MSSKKVNQASFSYGGQKLSLTKSRTQAAVRYTPGMKSSAGKRKKNEQTEQIRDFEVVRVARGIDKKLDELRAKPEVSVGTHVWHMNDEDDAAFIPTGYLYVEFKPGTDDDLQRNLMDEFHLNIREMLGPDAYRVNTTPESPNPIKCAIALQKKRIVSVAEPEFVTKPVTGAFSPPAGQFMASQWHLENTGGQIPIIDIPNAVFGTALFRKGADAKVKEAWALLQSLGNKDIRIAVIDTGFDTEHPQLRGDGSKIKNTFNAANRSADASPWFMASDGSWGVFDHGTSCAAVAAGAWDNRGVLGAAPNSRIIPIKLDILSDDAIVKAFEHALLNGADVISCSLGFPKPVPLSTWVFNTIRKVATTGRGGRGIPIFIAAGNANPASNNMPRLVSDFATHPDVICVTASNSLDEPSSYSFYGPNAFLCAPTNGNNGVGITTATVEVGDDGKSLSHTYTSGFGGTSSATPLAAGVCALMLSANPNLSLEQIKSILRSTCDKIASGYDANGRSQYLGYGRINAARAVKSAQQLAGGGQAPAPSGGGASTGGGGITVISPVNPGQTTGLRGKVTSKFLNVRTGPSATFSKVGELNQGDVVSLQEKVGGFWRIAVGQFVSADYIQVLANSTNPVAPAPATRQGKVISSFLNVRSGPGTTNAKVAELKQGALVTIFETSTNGWHRIGTGRWVIGSNVQEV
ncbi:MAG TPA: S8 family serine peptidase [Saprospiraceae bacterium]|nr:S8 family serine peptidase [Saprospiraceae bacterium]